MTTDCRSIIEEFLERVKAGNIPARDKGLCLNFVEFCTARHLLYDDICCAEKLLRSLMYTFPKYTGDPVYPLVFMDEYFAHLRASVDFYNPATSCGAIRLEFVDWALKELAQNRVSYMKS